MSSSTLAKNKETGNGVELLIDNYQLTIIEKKQDGSSTNGSTVETKQFLDLELIYGVNYTNETLTINLVEKQVPTDTATQNATLTNIRPQDIKWNLTKLQFVEVQGQQSFADLLSQNAVPKQNELSDTKVIVILNPTSGLRLAESSWKEIVKPMLLQAGFNESNITQVLTQSNGRTRALVEALGKKVLSSDAKSKTIFISLGGDGTLHEIVNGLKDVVEIGHFRLGVIPVGSGNAFALGLNLENVEQATLKIIKGQKEEPFYLMDVKFGRSNKEEDWQDNIQYDETKKPFRLLVVMSWGFHAQIVSKARYLRYFMGNKRFSLVAMFLLKFLQQYEGDLVLKNAKQYDAESKLFKEFNEDVVLNGT